MLSESDRRDIKKAADLLGIAFDWADTPQGSDYWLQVSENLYDIAGSLDKD